MKKLLITLVLILMLCLTAFTLTACDNDDKVCKHHNKDIEIVREATCKQTGLQKITCKDCGEFIEESVVPKASCIAGSWEITTNATCITKGSKRRSCVNCGRVLDVKEINILTHRYVDNICSFCGNINPTYTNGLVFSLMENNEICVSDYEYNKNSYSDLNVIIPSTYSGKPVTSIGSGAFANCTRLKSIVIPDNITSIGERAFYYCRSLTCIEIPDSVTSIGDSAFYNCDSLKSVVIGNNVTSIGERAFDYCDSLTSITIGSAVTSIGDSAFDYCSSLKILNYIGTIDSWVQIEFGSSAANPLCYALNLHINNVLVTEANITTATKINKCALYNCESLTSITIGSAVTSIGDSAFYNCRSLKKVNHTGTIDSWAQIEFGSYDANPLCYAGKLYINNVLVTEANITTATKINNSAFYNCDSLKSVVIDNNVTSIGERAFYDCDLLRNVTIGNSVISISTEVFSYCSLLTSVTISNSVTSVGADIFYLSDSLKAIYCEAENQTIGWDRDWKDGCNAEVVWGYKGEN